MISARNIEKTSQKGFTLIELLVVIGILAILLSIVLIAINPARQFQQANDTKRRSDVGAILNAIGAYAADNHGVLPAGIPVVNGAVGTPADPGSVTTVCHALLGSGDADDATGPSYISALPTDPGITTYSSVTACGAGAKATGYTVQQDSAGRVTVTAPSGQIAGPISVQR